jgi:hypothetical protein
MHRVLLVALFALVFAPAAFGADIYVTNHSSLTDAEIADAIPVYQRALDEDLAPIWPEARGSKLILGEAPKGAWSVRVVDQPGCFYCSGYHDLEDGVPYAVVSALDEWQVAFTHELWELLVNPYIERSAVVKGKLVKGKREKRKYALETADPVEGDQFAYQRQSASDATVHISDFVTPAWFRRGSKGPWDFARKTRRPLQILEDGYQLWFHDGGWDAIWAGDGARADGLAKAGRWNGGRAPSPPAEANPRRFGTCVKPVSKRTGSSASGIVKRTLPSAF